MPREQSNGSMNTIIGGKSRLEGNFQIVGSVKVEGVLKGALNASEQLVVGQGARVMADLEVKQAVIGGQFTGTITASERIELESTARVQADLKTSHLVIHEGAIFHGNIDSGSSTAVPAPEPKAGK